MASKKISFQGKPATTLPTNLDGSVENYRAGEGFDSMRAFTEKKNKDKTFILFNDFLLPQ